MQELNPIAEATANDKNLHTCGRQETDMERWTEWHNGTQGEDIPQHAEDD